VLTSVDLANMPCYAAAKGQHTAAMSLNRNCCLGALPGFVRSQFSEGQRRIGAAQAADRRIGGVIGLEQDEAGSATKAQHGDGSSLIRRRGRPAMKLSAALDTSTAKTAICVVNSRDGTIVFEASVATDPAIIFETLAPYLPRLDKVGHEASSVAAWLHRELTALGCQWCCRRHATRRLRCRFSATRPTRMMRGHWRIWCAQAGIGQCMSKARRAISCGCCSDTAAR
jgi:hypothetical protein